jgi:hypothetical protein
MGSGSSAIITVDEGLLVVVLGGVDVLSALAGGASVPVCLRLRSVVAKRLLSV